MPSQQKNSLLIFIFGCVCSSFSAILGGTTFVYTRLIVSILDPTLLSLVRYGIIGLLFLFIFFFHFYKVKFKKTDIFFMIIIGIFMFTLFPIFMALGLELTTSSRAGLLYATMPIFTVIIACFFKIEKFSISKLVSVFIAFSGVYYCLSEFIDPSAPNPLEGDLLMLIGVISASVFTVFSGKYLKKYGNVNVLIFTILTGSIATMFVSIMIGNNLSDIFLIPKINYIYIFMLTVPGGVLMMFLWGKALQLISPTQASITLGLNPLSATILGHFTLDEVVSSRIIIAIFIILIAIVVSKLDKN